MSKNDFGGGLLFKMLLRWVYSCLFVPSPIRFIGPIFLVRDFGGDTLASVACKIEMYCLMKISDHTIVLLEFLNLTLNHL